MRRNSRKAFLAAFLLITGASSVLAANFTYRQYQQGLVPPAIKSEELPVAPPPPVCSLPWGGTLANGSSVQAYRDALVPYGSTCVVQTRSCSGTDLSGSYPYQACSVSAPVAASLVGNGVSTKGACASGELGCATFSPTDKSSAVTLSNGNLTAIASATGDSVRGTLGKSAGKWYWEYTVTAAPAPNNSMLGIGTANMLLANYPGTSVEGYGYWGNNGSSYYKGTSYSGGTSYGAGAVIGVAFDADNHTLTFYKNGAAARTFTAVAAVAWHPAVSPYTSGATSTITANFGQSNFAYAPPNGYHAGLY